MFLKFVYGSAPSILTTPDHAQPPAHQAKPWALDAKMLQAKALHDHATTSSSNATTNIVAIPNPHIHLQNNVGRLLVRATTSGNTPVCLKQIG